jgi:hypothetical protein
VRVDLHKLIWGPLHIPPIHNFITWLAVLNRLSIKACQVHISEGYSA